MTVLIMKLFEYPTLSWILRWSLCRSSASSRDVHRLRACPRYLLSFFLFLLEAVGHTILSIGVELLIVRIATIYLAFNRYIASEGTFSFLATFVCFVILLSQDLNNDCFNQIFIVQVSLIQVISCFYIERLPPEYSLYDIISQLSAKIVTHFVV